MTLDPTPRPGPDHLTWYHLKHLADDNSFLQLLTNLYNDILDSGIWPSTFKESYSVIIPKPNKVNYNTAKMYCPIALLNTLGKLFTKILAKRINQDCAVFGLLHPSQCGGMPNAKALLHHFSLLTSRNSFPPLITTSFALCYSN
ncbi:hypothetical protein AX17_006815 [Amanita inopinata Kibby_2008]|nr:hypothetical protein AX17_006815 [Amanita inopinata Kibby_2008]